MDIAYCAAAILPTAIFSVNAILHRDYYLQHTHLPHVQDAFTQFAGKFIDLRYISTQNAILSIAQGSLVNGRI